MKKRTGLLIISGSIVSAIFASGLIVWALSSEQATPKAFIAISGHAQQSTTATAKTPVMPTASELLSLVNSERVKAGAPALELDNRLNTSAQRKADDEAKYNYFGHVSPKDNKHGYEYINDVSIACKTDSENLYWGNGDLTSAQSAVNWWMNSAPHKAAMLEAKYSLTGFGVALMPDGKTVTVVEHFCQA